MKRRVLPFLMALLMTLALLPAGAAAAEHYVYDDADLLTVEEWQLLDAKAEEISLRQGIGVYILAMPGYADYGSTFGEAMETLYKSLAFGIGEEKSGILLFIDSEEMAYSFYLGGDAVDFFTDSDISYLEGKFIPELADGNWYTGYSLYLQYADEILSQGVKTATASEDYVKDYAGILSASERALLEQNAAAITAQYQCGVYIVVVEDYTDYASSVLNAAKAVFERYGLGTGENHDGMMLFMSMDDRDYYLLAHGYGSAAFTAYGTTLLEDAFLDDFRGNDWYSGFADYLSECASLLSSAASGNIVSSDDPSYQNGYYVEKRGPDVMLIVICYGIGLIVAGIFVGINYAKLKSAHKATEASDYTTPRSLNLYRQQDFYTHTTETRRRIETQSSRSSGGGGGGGGYSGRGGKF